jgi:beta-lactamase superfamily II metal-dependent hydrolase
MPKAGTLSYIEPLSRAYKPIAHVDPGRTPWDKVAFLWGDPVYVISVDGSEATVSAKGHHVTIPTKDLMDTPLLRVSLIDVGQGDSVLVEFPDMRWMLVDGGPPRMQNWTNTGKIAFDFLKWKIYRDFSWRREFNFDPITQTHHAKPPPFHIDAIVVTHPDFDHYGGLHELPGKVAESDPFERITVGTIYHCGLGRFSKPYTDFASGAGMSQLGPLAGTDLPEAFLTTLIDGFQDVRTYGKKTPSRSYTLSGDYANWLSRLADLEGKGVKKLMRLHHVTNGGFVPGFEGSEDPSIRILGPVEEAWKGKPALRYIDTASAVDDPSLTRNGLSVVLRLDYGDARILLTGDLNFRSQAVLLKHVPGQEYRAHVVKACHHGSEDVSWKFLQATDPVAVMVSSGDNESHVHPRAKVLGWSGAFATPIQSGKDKSYLGLTEASYRSPLIYSTELSRSVQLWEPHAVLEKDGDDLVEVKNPHIQPRARSLTKPDSEDPRPMKDWLLADRLLYGLINVRTDGKKVVMGVMKESGTGFQTETFSV